MCLALSVPDVEYVCLALNILPFPPEGLKPIFKRPFFSVFFVVVVFVNFGGVCIVFSNHNTQGNNMHKFCLCALPESWRENNDVRKASKKAVQLLTD